MSTPTVTLPAEAVSVPAARRFVCDRLVQLGAAAACDDAEVLVSELATNAVVHARTPFTVEVTRDGQTVRVCVLDAAPARPRVRDYGRDATTGRGMRLVVSIASDWGVEPRGPGKTVWFELPAAGSTSVVPPWEEEVDVEELLAGFDDDSSEATTATVRAAA